MRWNLLRDVVEVQRGKKAQAVADWPPEEYSAELLLLEMMAQTAGLVFGSLDDFQSDVVFAKVENAAFKVTDTDKSSLAVTATGEEIRPEGGWFNACVFQSGNKIAEAKLLLANAGKLDPVSNRSLTFHESFMSHYRVRDKVHLGEIAS